MLEIENTLLTGSISLDSDTDGNVIIMQNRQEIKITPSQAKKLESFLLSVTKLVNTLTEDSEKQNVCPLCNIILSVANSVNSAYHVEDTVCYDCYIKAKGE